MCGFVALLGPPSAVGAHVLDAMRDQLAHRGPDGKQSWITTAATGARVGLGHRRLAIIDLSDAAAQPMFNADGSLAIVHNGEIYNYVELRRELESEGAVFRTRSDTEVLLASYERWGEAALDRLNGMFAFAIWDARRQMLFVARDRFGEKPLFYGALPGGGIAIASEMKALFAHPALRAAPDEDEVQSYVAGRYYEDGEATLFRGVRRLPPAHAAIIDQSGQFTRRWRYWTPDYTAIQNDYEESEAVSHFASLLERSVTMRLRSDVPVGTSLSGGLDSSMLVCLLSQVRGSASAPQNTFSSRFATDPTISEGPYIDLVTRRAAVRPFAVDPDPDRLAEECRLVHWHQEEPFLSSSIYAQWCVMRLAAEHETTVLIDGQGADELLAGYQFYFRSYQLDRLDTRQLVPLVADTLRFNARLARASKPYAQSARRFNRRIALSLPQAAAFLLKRPPVFHGDYHDGVPPALPGWRLRRQIAEALLYNSLPMLLRYADRNAMAFSRETRFPFLDYDLVDWCVTLPDRALISRGWQKYILRRAGEGVIPREIQWRADKVGYAAPLDLWLRGSLREWASQRLFQGPITELDGYDATSLRATWDAHQSGAAESSWALWRWISLNEWFGLLDEGRWRVPLAA